MNSQTLLNLALIIHITGFTMLAGTIIADYVISRRLSKFIISDKQRAIAVLDTTAGLGRLIGIGGGLLLITGIAMVMIFKGTVAQMLWFKIKMVLVILVILNGVGVLQRGTGQLRKMLEPDSTVNNGQITALKGRLNTFHFLEILLFLIIFILSVIRF
ncbi:MAG: hypothetical protein JST42_30400 [Bacteroidetes bacterium]|nr:hypothetical protein [Bacteroidota bacterium]